MLIEFVSWICVMSEVMNSDIKKTCVTDKCAPLWDFQSWPSKNRCVGYKSKSSWSGNEMWSIIVCNFLLNSKNFAGQSFRRFKNLRPRSGLQCFTEHLSFRPNTSPTQWGAYIGDPAIGRSFIHMSWNLPTRHKIGKKWLQNLIKSLKIVQILKKI